MFTLEIHCDAVGTSHNVVIVDDLLATGGTAKAVTQLVERLGGNVVGLSFMVEVRGRGWWLLAIKGLRIRQPNKSTENGYGNRTWKGKGLVSD